MRLKTNRTTKTHRSSMRYALKASAAMCLAMSMNYAIAQEAADDDATVQEQDGEDATNKLGTIYVTAQKREQGINDVGITVNAFSADQLKNYGVRSANDLESITPGLTISDAQPVGIPVYTIRGVGFSDFSVASSSTVGLYFDEANIAYAVMSRGALFDIERVEVLKGPQGDLYGRNTTAGQINFVSRKPTEEFEAGITADYGRFNAFELEGFLSGPISDNVRGRLSGKTIQHGDGWQRSVSRPGDTLGERDEVAVRGLLDIDFSPSTSALLNLHYFRDQSDNIAPSVIDGTIDGNPSPVTATPGPFTPIFSEGDSRAADWSADPALRPSRDNTLLGFNAKVEHDFGNGLSFTSVTAYDTFERDPEIGETSGTAFEDAVWSQETEIDVFSQEFRLQSDANEDVYWIVGAFYSDDTVKEDFVLNMADSFFGAFLGIDEVLNSYEQDTTSIAGFGHVEWQFTDQLRLTLGARYTEEEREWTGCTFDSGSGGYAAGWNNALVFAVVGSGAPNPGPLAAGECATYNDVQGSPGFGTFGIFSDTIETEEWMWKTTLDYAPNDDVLLYGTISRGFKSGGFNGAAAQTHTQLRPIRPETLLSYEVGMKSTLLDGNMQLNAAAFYYDYEDKQEPSTAITPVGPIGGLDNVDESRSMGAEVETRWLIDEGLVFDLGIAYLDTEILEYDAIDAATSVWPNIQTIDASGFDLANSPEWQINSTITKTWPISDSLDMMIAGDASYKSDNEGSNQNPLSDYFLVNARAGISSSDGRWSLTAWGRNIFDDHYWVAASTSNGTFTRTYGMPATYGVTLGWNF